MIVNAVDGSQPNGVMVVDGSQPNGVMAVDGIVQRMVVWLDSGPENGVAVDGG